MRQLFNVRLLAGLIVAGVMAFAAFLFFSAYSDEFRFNTDGRGHAVSKSAIGFHGLVRLVELTGGKTSLSRSIDSLDENGELLVVVLEPQSSAEELKELIEARTGEDYTLPTLVILPKWIAGPDPRHRGWIVQGEPGLQSAAAAALGKFTLAAAQANRPRRSALGSGELERLSVPEPRRAQTISGENVSPLLSVPGEGALLARVNGVYVLADPDLMNNQGLKDRQTAGAAMEILSRLNAEDAEGVTFDLTINGLGRKPSIYKLAFEPPFLTLTLALFVAAILAGLHGAFRFGPAAREERAIAFGKLALVENSAGLIQLARREHRAGGAYADVIRDSAAAASGAPPQLHGEALEAYLDKLSQKEGSSFSSLALALRTVGDRHDLLRAARALFQWKKDNIR